MTTTPLPPLPEPYQEALEPFLAYTAGQMRNYATAARADLEAENARLREALESFTKSDYIKKQHPKRYAAARAALEPRA